MTGRMTWGFASPRPASPRPATPLPTIAIPAEEYVSDEGPFTIEESIGVEEELLSYGSPSASPVSIAASHVTNFSPNGPILSSPQAWVQPSPCARFWFSDGSLVNRTLYKVHKSIMMQQSYFFQEELTARTLPPSPLKLKEGKNANRSIITWVEVGLLENPLVLHNVTNSGFELLLSFIYPTDYRSQYDLTVHEWSEIVNTSTTLQLYSIRTVAVDNIIKHANPLDLIDSGRQYSIPECLLEGYRQLCGREESLSLEEGQKLGVASIIKIAHAREMIAKGSTWSELEKEFND